MIAEKKRKRRERRGGGGGGEKGKENAYTFFMPGSGWTTASHEKGRGGRKRKKGAKGRLMHPLFSLICSVFHR